jgi:deoxyribodipyrimidine photo-lyase
MSSQILRIDDGGLFPGSRPGRPPDVGPRLTTEMPRHGTAIWWVRRDLRLADNEALYAALAAAERVVPVFVRDPALTAQAGVSEKRLAFLYGGLRALDADLRARGSRLIVRTGEPELELLRLAREVGAHAVFAEADASPFAARRDAWVAAVLPLKLAPGLTVHAPGEVIKAAGGPYTVFTPFMRAWKALPFPGEPLPAPDRIDTPPDVASEPVPDEPTLPAAVPFVPGEAAARRRLTAFLDGPVYDYGEARDRMDVDGTSGLSPYLRFGMISARAAAAAARVAVAAAPDAASATGAETWLKELIWREFYIHVVYHHPGVLRAAFREDLRDIAWLDDPHAFDAWCAGRTGYPVVDAAMRQLATTGWMHNRARMIVASFLVKDLLVDWRRGERFFMRHLVDGDPAANNGGWQWTAGTGTDAAPYFRVFNPVLQGAKFDPDGSHVRRWVPELAKVPTSHIHAPWTLSPAAQHGAGCRIGHDYPAPIVDHAMARERALAAYADARANAGPSEA